MPQDSSPRVTSGIPEQRSPAVGRHAAAHAEPEEQPLPDETVVLPAFITGKPEPLPERPKPAAEPVPPADPDRLPPSERGMLIFVATLLGLGGLAVVVMLGVGGFGSPPQSAGAATTTPAVSPVPTPTPSPSLSPVASAPAPTTPAPKPTTTPPKKPSPTVRFLGMLSAKDPAAYCAALDAGRAGQHSDHSWYCRGSSAHPQSMPFTSTDVCRWRYLDKTAYAVAGDIDQPSTWKCYT